MKNIMPMSDDHKPGAALLAVRFCLFLLAAALLAAAGCGDKDVAQTTADLVETATETPDVAPATGSDTGQGPVLICENSSIRAWTRLAQKLRNGTPPIDLEYEMLFETPAYKLVYVDLSRRNVIKPANMKRVMEFVFAESASDEGTKPKRQDLVKCYSYLRDNFDAVKSVPDVYGSEAFLGRVRELVTKFIPAETLPAEIFIQYLAGKPSITFNKPNTIAVDVGLLIASDTDQAARIIASRLYSILAEKDGIMPDETTSGTLALAGAYRMLRRSAITGWIGDNLSHSFDDSHELLRHTNPDKQMQIKHAATLITRSAMMMSNLFGPENEKALNENGDQIHDLYRLGNGYELSGWAMAALIVEILGEERLREVSGDTIAFMRAYQEAATKNRSTGDLAEMPAYPDPLFENLLAHIAGH